MDFIRLLEQLQENTEFFTTQDILLILILSFVLSYAIGLIYRDTHRGTSYTQTFVHTLPLMSMVVAMIMLVIGSNIARAFSLVGALSIIRFRNAVKDTRDVGFIFFAMAIGMACGTRFYMVAIIATVVIGFFTWAMARFDMFAKEASEQLLRVRLPGDMPYETAFEDLFSRYLNRYTLVAMETVQAGTLTELVYTIEPKSQADLQQFLNEIRERNFNNKVVLITGQQQADL